MQQSPKQTIIVLFLLLIYQIRGYLFKNKISLSKNSYEKDKIGCTINFTKVSPVSNPNPSEEITGRDIFRPKWSLRNLYFMFSNYHNKLPYFTLGCHKLQY